MNSTKKSQLNTNKTPADGIRDIFKKIRQNEEQVKESSIRKKKTGKYYGSSTNQMKKTRYAANLEEELK
jgi:hypothetical protein